MLIIFNYYCFILLKGTSEEIFPVAPLDQESNSDVSVTPVTWDLLATILTDDREGMIFRQRVHVFSIPIASSNKLIVSAELSSKESQKYQILQTTNGV